MPRAGTPADSPEARARELLFSKLTPDQARSVRYNRFIPVTGSLGGRYRINISGTVSNIESPDRRVRYCVGPVRDMPNADILLCQKLLIEADEGLFLRTACKSYLLSYDYVEIR